jgi:hypothetical protein
VDNDAPNRLQTHAVAFTLLGSTLKYAFDGQFGPGALASTDNNQHETSGTNTNNSVSTNPAHTTTNMHSTTAAGGSGPTAIDRTGGKGFDSPGVVAVVIGGLTLLTVALVMTVIRLRRVHAIVRRSSAFDAARRGSITSMHGGRGFGSIRVARERCCWVLPLPWLNPCCTRAVLLGLALALA